MIKLDFYTRLGKNEIDSSFLRPKIYISYQRDGRSFLESLISQILTITDAVIYYINYEESTDLNKEEINDYLNEMNVIIIAIDENYLDEREDNFSYKVEKEIFFRNNAPIIPILKHHEDIEKYREYYHEVQCLIIDETLKGNDKPFIDKLENHLHRFILKDTFYQKASQAFERIVFLSYRKMDKALAKELMDDIYHDMSCAHIGVWYDDFLIPGESFKKALEDKIYDSDLFMMLITPNIVIPGNYIQTDEYPYATSNGIDVLPVEIKQTDRKSLETIYRNIPSCVNKKDVNSLLLDRYESNDNSDETIFERGVAFFNGINVVTNKELGLKLIKIASDKQSIDAMIYLADLYLNGNFVSKNYDKAEELYQNVINLIKPSLTKDSWNDISILYFKIKTLLSDIALMANQGKEKAKSLAFDVINELEATNVPQDKEREYEYYHFLYEAYKRVWGYDGMNTAALDKQIEIVNILMELNPDESKDEYLDVMFNASLLRFKNCFLDIAKLIEIKEEYKKLVSKDVNKYLYRFTQILTTICGFSKGNQDLILDLEETLDLIDKIGNDQYRDIKITAKFYLIREKYRYGEIEAKEAEHQTLLCIQEAEDIIENKYTLLNLYLLLSEAADEARDTDVDIYALKKAHDVNEELRKEFGDELADGIDVSIRCKEALCLIRKEQFEKAKALILPIENKTDVIADKVSIYHILCLCSYDDEDKAKYYFSLFKKYQKIFISNTSYDLCRVEINTYLQICVTFLRTINSDDVSLIKKEVSYIVDVINSFKKDDIYERLETVNNALYSVFNENLGGGHLPNVYSFIVKEFVKNNIEISHLVKEDSHLAHSYLYSVSSNKVKYATFLDDESDYELEKANREVILSRLPYLKDKEEHTIYLIYLAVNTLRLGRVVREKERLNIYQEYKEILEDKQKGTDLIANISISVYFVALGYLNTKEYKQEIVDKLGGGLYSVALLNYLHIEDEEYESDVLDKHLNIYTSLYENPVRLTSDHAQIALLLFNKNRIRLLYNYSLSALDSCLSIGERETDDPVEINALYYFYRVSILTCQMLNLDYVQTLLDEVTQIKRLVLDSETFMDYPYLHPDAGQILAKLLFKKYIEYHDIDALREVAYTAFAIYNYARSQDEPIKAESIEIACNIFTKYQYETYQHQDQHQTLIDHTISFLALLDAAIRLDMTIPVLEQACRVTSLLNEAFFNVKNYQSICEFCSRMMKHIISLGEDIENFDNLLVIKMYSDLAHALYYQGQKRVALNILREGLTFIKLIRNFATPTPILSFLDLLFEITDNNEEKDEVIYLHHFFSPHSSIKEKVSSIQRLIVLEYREGYDKQALYYAEEGIKLISSLKVEERKQLLEQLKDFYKSAIMIAKGLDNEDLAYHYTLLLRKID